MVDAWDQFPDPPKPQNESDPWSQFPDHSLSWADVPGQAINNLPASALGVAEGIANTVMHPIDTAQGLYNIGKGAVSKAAGVLGVEQEPETKAQNEAAINAVGQFFADRYGGMENFKRTIAEDPAGFALDLSTILSGGQAALARVPGAARAATTVGKVAEAINPVNLAGRAVTGIPIPKTGLKAGAEPVVSNVLGMTTGTGEGPVRQAARAGFQRNKAFADNMRGNVPMTDVIDQAQFAVGRMRQDRSAEYQAGMTQANQAAGHVGYQPIHQALVDADKMVNFQGLAKSAEAAKTLEQIKDLVSQWRGLSTPHTVEAADALKQAIGEIRQKTQPGTLERRVADSVYNAAKSSIVQQAPEYAKAMKGYADASDKINELERTFSLGEKASQDTALRKLQSTQRNNVQTNYGQRNALLDELARYEPDLPFALAGQSMNAALPRGLAGKVGAISVGSNGGMAMHGLPAIMNPATLAMLPTFSPRVVGEAAYAGGRVANALMPIAQYIPEAVKAGYVVNALAQPSLRGGIGPRYDENGNPISVP
jgi:hypothetical protein